MKAHRVLWIAGIVCGLSLCNLGWAQRKPEAPRLETEEKPRESLVPADFLEAYRRADSPRLLIFSYVITVDANQREALNEVGVAQMFNARLRNHFTHPDITLLDLPITDLQSKTDFRKLASSDHLGAAELLSRDTGADVVVLVILTEQSGRADGVRYAASYDVVDVNRNHRIGQHSWEMSPELSDGTMDVVRLEKYAQAVARRIREDFAIYYPSAKGGVERKFTVKVTGVPGDKSVALRDALRAISGVKADTRVDYDGSGDAVFAMDLRYTGDPIVLADATSKASSRVLGRKVVFTVSRQGLIALEATARTSSPQELILSGDRSSGSESAEAQSLRQRMEQAYQRAGAPSIAVMVNQDVYWTPELKEAKTAEKQAESSGGGMQVNVVVDSVVNSDQPSDPSDTSGTVQKLSDEELLNRQEMENRMLERLRGMKIHVQDLQQALRLLAKEKNFQTGVWDDLHLARVLGEKARADIVISGSGRVQRNESSVELEYTFRAYALHSAEVLAAATVYDNTIGTGTTDLHALTDKLSAQAVGKLMLQMMESWEQLPPASN